jgi:hypothetical protein
VKSPTGFLVPRAIRVVDDIFLHPEKLFSPSEFAEKQKEINRVRYEAVEKIGAGLYPDILKVFRPN